MTGTGAAGNAMVAAGIALALGLTLGGCSDTLPAKGTVTGTVVDRAGTAMSGCTVTRDVRGENPYPFTEEAGSTDREGRFSWEMYPGSYSLTVVCLRSRELRGISEVVDVRSDQDTAVSVTVV